MKKYIENRVIECANFILDTEGTIRGTATKLSYSKSTVHKDLRERLPLVNAKLGTKVNNLLDKNKAERSKRGGEALKNKYKKNKKLI